MRKLLRGIAEFRRTRRPDYAETFARLALGQKPDALLVACSDSRVVPNLFASTEPGDLFVVRNVGNLIPPCGADGRSTSDESEAAAVEFALRVLSVRVTAGQVEDLGSSSLRTTVSVAPTRTTFRTVRDSIVPSARGA